MKKQGYRERDYAFGQLVLTLRTNIGLTQAGLAYQLGVSRRAIAEWEAGSSYPKPEHLKQLIALGVQQQTFSVGQEAEEIRSLWKAARRKVPLHEGWLQGLLGQPRSLQAITIPQQDKQTDATHRSIPPDRRRREDWGDAPAVPTFYGREGERAELTQWILEERCRVISVLGLGGIGKSVLTTSVMHQVAPDFEVVIWRSLRDAPPCDTLLDECLQVLAPQPMREVPSSMERRLSWLIGALRDQRALLVLDNLETLLEEGESSGRMRSGYEGYARLLRRVAETEHQSCLLLTSREKPGELVALEGSRTPVRALRLEGLAHNASERLLEEREIAGSAFERERLIEHYGGNPLALKIVAEMIVELFGGEIALFLEQDEFLVGNVRDLLSEQFNRLSNAEQTVLFWLAILREPVTIEELLAVLGTPLPRVQVLKAVEALRRRSLIERGHQRGSFTLQSVVLEYATARLIDEAASEIEAGRLSWLIEQGLELAISKEYVRQTQHRLLVAPLLEQLHRLYPAREELESRLLVLLSEFRERADYAQGYGPANVLALLCLQCGHLRGLDLSGLVLRSVSLQGVEMQDTLLVGAHLEKVVFSEAFDAIFSVAISPDGRYWAAGSNSGEVRIWREEGQTAHVVMRAHANAVSAVAFSPEGRMLASGSWDCTVKIWDVASKSLIWNLQGHHGYVQSVAFRPDGGLLASGSDDGTIKLWDLRTGSCLRTLRGHQDNVYQITWHPDGRRLASGSFDWTIRIWDAESGDCLRMLNGHTSWVMAVAFTPDGKFLASGGADNTVNLWEVESGQRLQTLRGHSGPVKSVAWNSDGRTLVSGSYDTTIRLWRSDQAMTCQILSGHTDVIHSVAIAPDGKMVLSGSEDRTLRVWEVNSRQCLRILQGHSISLYALAWSPDSNFLAIGGTDCTIRLWDRARNRFVKSLKGHTQAVYTLAWHPNGCLLASGGCDQTVRMWDSATGELLHVFQADASQVTRVAWSPDGAWLASTSYDKVVRMWDISEQTCRWVGYAHTSLVSAVCWSPDGSRLATGSDDKTVRLWQAEDGTLLSTLQGHNEDVASVAWSPDGRIVASGGGGGRRGELLLWDGESGHLLRSLVGHSSHVFTIAWSPQGDILVSASIDGTLRWWDVEGGECLHMRQGHQGWISEVAISSDGETLASCGHDGVTHLWRMSSAEHLGTLRADRLYERLNIMGIRGLTHAEITILRALGAIEDAASNSPEHTAQLWPPRLASPP